jgi:hypothetical protein
MDGGVSGRILTRRILMKLVRYGALGRERPGMLDAQGRIRDLIEDRPTLPARRSPKARQCASSSPTSCRWCAAPRASALRRQGRQLHRHRAQLCRPCRRGRHAAPQGAAWSSTRRRAPISPGRTTTP